MDQRKNIAPVIVAIAAAAAALFLLSMCGGMWLLLRYHPGRGGKGYRDYTVRQELYYSMYSEQYPYLETITVEYPRIEGIDENIQESVNTLMYDMAMDRVNYWHLQPSDDVQAFQEEEYQIFASDVSCDITYHSQYLLSISFEELYCPGNPVFLTKYTQRALNIDLTTGRTYELSDIFRMDEDFIRLWQRKADPAYGLSASDDEITQILLAWFSGEDGELDGLYEFRPFFHLTEDGYFVIGLSLDPAIDAVYYGGAQENSTFRAVVSAKELEPWRTDSEFWKQYEKSKETGTILPCENREANLWLGKEASIWDYYEEYAY